MRFPAYLSVNRVALPRLFSRIFKGLYVLNGLLMVALRFNWLGPDLYSVYGLVSVTSFVAIVASFVLSFVDSFHRGEVEVTPDAVVLRRERKGTRIVPRSSIVSALAVHRPHPGVHVSTVELTLANGDRLHLRLNDAAAAATIVSALGFGPEGARLPVDLAMPSRRWLHLLLGFGVYAFAMVVSAFLLAASRGREVDALQAGSALLQMALYVPLVKLLAAPRVVVGRDGVLVERGWKRKAYRAGDPALPNVLRGIGVDGARVDAVVHAARERAVGGGAAIGALFERGGLSLPEWRARIVSALDGGYRASGNVTELARSVLASADVTPDERVGAALALRVAGDVEPVRRAAVATADDRVRVVLDAMADGADDVVERRLREL
ncbi:MAG: hypothetical protein KIT84_19015 [Labilithrix sp.]|nr:hypothetical protein [Labilithrix sp.]MCW5813126.1 hypothetical protein [Labilithrix sp.]